MLVNREAVIDAILALETETDSPTYRICIENACKAVSMLPSAVAQGEWIPSINPDLPGYLMCSCCREMFVEKFKNGKFEYCPHCGADLREVKNEIS